MKLIHLIVAISTTMLTTVTFAQAPDQSVVYQLNNEVKTAENVLVSIGNGIKKDKHKDMETQLHNFENSITAFDTQKNNLKGSFSSGLDDKLNGLKGTFNSFEKIVHKSKLFDKDKELKIYYEKLNTDLASIKSYVNYIQEELNKAEAKRQQELALQQQQQATEVANQQQTNQLEGDNQKAVGILKTKPAQIDTQLSKIDAALKKGIYKDVTEHSQNITNLISGMSSVTNDLTSKKSVIISLLNTVKGNSTKLGALSKEGHHKDHDIHHELKELKANAAKLKAEIAGLN